MGPDQTSDGHDEPWARAPMASSLVEHDQFQDLVCLQDESFAAGIVDWSFAGSASAARIDKGTFSSCVEMVLLY